MVRKDKAQEFVRLLKSILLLIQENGCKIDINEENINIESLENIIEIRNPSPKDIQTHELFIDLIKKMLAFNPEDRISAEDAFLHPFIGGTFS